MTEEITVESTVQKFLVLKMFSETMYVGNINQFVDIINGDDHDNIREFYPNKDTQFFKDVLDKLNESYEV